MSSQIKKCCCFVIAILISLLCYSQRQFHITIEFVPKLDSLKLGIWFDNGNGLAPINYTITNGKIEIVSKVYSKYATLSLNYLKNTSQKNYYITNEESSIIFSGQDKKEKNYPFINGKVTNALEIPNCREIKELIAYTEKERADLIDFENKHKTEFGTNDSLNSILKQKGKLFDKKTMDFIRLNSNQYFYLWYFNMGLMRSEYTEPDRLLQFFREVLYPKYSDLFETKRILDYLIGRTLKINQPAPDFTTTDIAGRKFSLSQLKGKYVLINIWATWCGSCVAELPLFAKLRADFPEDQLEMISVSVDNPKADLENGIKKYGLNWTHIFRDLELINKYQISGGIPKTFLIDKEGEIVFMIVGGLANTDELRKLLLKK